MKRENCIALTLMIALLSASASATMFIRVEKRDPISGETVTVHDVVSYGGYIYDAPSKYDQVFWPYTDEPWILFCPGTGYASFGDDFEELTEEETTRLSLWLKENYDPSEKATTHREKLDWAERVYAQREKDNEFWCHFYRLQAYMCRDDAGTSLAHVRKALPLLEEKLQKAPQGMARIRVLFLLGEYHRRLGDEQQSRRHFHQAKAAKYTDDDGVERTGHPYFLELINDKNSPSKAPLGLLAGIVCALAVGAGLFLRWQSKT